MTTNRDEGLPCVHAPCSAPQVRAATLRALASLAEHEYRTAAQLACPSLQQQQQQHQPCLPRSHQELAGSGRESGGAQQRKQQQQQQGPSVRLGGVGGLAGSR